MKPNDMSDVEYLDAITGDISAAIVVPCLVAIVGAFMLPFVILFL